MQNTKALSNTPESKGGAIIEKRESNLWLNGFISQIKKHATSIINFPSNKIKEKLSSLWTNIIWSQPIGRTFSPAMAAALMCLVTVSAAKDLYANVDPQQNRLSIWNAYESWKQLSPVSFKDILDKSYNNSVTIKYWVLKSKGKTGLDGMIEVAKKTDWYNYIHGKKFKSIASKLQDSDTFTFFKWKITHDQTSEIIMTYRKQWKETVEQDKTQGLKLKLSYSLQNQKAWTFALPANNKHNTDINNQKKTLKNSTHEKPLINTTWWDLKQNTVNNSGTIKVANIAQWPTIKKLSKSDIVKRFKTKYESIFTKLWIDIKSQEAIFKIINGNKIYKSRYKLLKKIPNRRIKTENLRIYFTSLNKIHQLSTRLSISPTEVGNGIWYLSREKKSNNESFWTLKDKKFSNLSLDDLEYLLVHVADIKSIAEINRRKKARDNRKYPIDSTPFMFKKWQSTFWWWWDVNFRNTESWAKSFDITRLSPRFSDDQKKIIASGIPLEMYRAKSSDKKMKKGEILGKSSEKDPKTWLPYFYWRKWNKHILDEKKVEAIPLSFLSWDLTSKLSHAKIGQDSILNTTFKYEEDLDDWITIRQSELQLSDASQAFSLNFKRKLFEDTLTVDSLEADQISILKNQTWTNWEEFNTRRLFKEQWRIFDNVTGSLWSSIWHSDSWIKLLPGAKLWAKIPMTKWAINIEAWSWIQWIFTKASAHWAWELAWLNLSSYSVKSYWKTFSTLATLSSQDLWTNLAAWVQITTNPIFLWSNSLIFPNFWISTNKEDWTKESHLIWLFQYIKSLEDKMCWSTSKIEITWLGTWNESKTFTKSWQKITIGWIEFTWDEVAQCVNWNLQSRISPEEDRNTKLKLVYTTKLLNNLWVASGFTKSYIKSTAINSSKWLKDLENVYETLFDQSFNIFKTDYIASDNNSIMNMNHLIKYSPDRNKEVVNVLKSYNKSNNINQSIADFLTKNKIPNVNNMHMGITYIIKEFVFRYATSNWANISNIIINNDAVSNHGNDDYDPYTRELTLSTWWKKFPDLRSLKPNKSVEMQLKKNNVFSDKNRVFIEKTWIPFKVGKLTQNQINWTSDHIWNMSPIAQSWLNNFITHIRFLAENKASLDAKWQIFTIDKMFSKVITSKQDIVTIKRILAYFGIAHNWYEETQSWWIYLAEELLEKFANMSDPFVLTDKKINKLMADLDNPDSDWSDDKFLEMQISDYMHMWSWLERFLISKWLEFNAKNERKLYKQSTKDLLKFLKRYDRLYWLKKVITTDIWWGEDEDEIYGNFELDRNSNTMYVNIPWILLEQELIKSANQRKPEIKQQILDIQSTKDSKYEWVSNIWIDELLDQSKKSGIDDFDTQIWESPFTECEISLLTEFKQKEKNQQEDIVLNPYLDVFYKMNIKRSLYKKDLLSRPEVKELIQEYKDKNREIEQAEQRLIEDLDSELNLSQQHAAIKEIINTTKDQFQRNSDIIKGWKKTLYEYKKLKWKKYSWKRNWETMSVTPEDWKVQFTYSNWKKVSYELFKNDWSQWKDFEIFKTKHEAEFLMLNTWIDYYSDWVMPWAWFNSVSDKNDDN